MKKKFFKATCAVMALTLGVAAAATMTGCKKDEEAFFIATSGPLTGDYAKYGLGVKNGATMAVEEINKVAEKELGFKFKFDMADDQADPDQVETKYHSFVESGMQISLGTVTSGACLAWKALAKDDNIFCLTPSATSDLVYADADYMYQMCFSDNNQGTAAAQYVKANITKGTVGIFYQTDSEYSKGIYDTFKAEMGSAFSEYVKAEAVFTADANTDFASQIQTLKDCDFVFMPIYYTEASLFMKGATSGTSITKYYGCDGLDGIDSVENFNINSIPQEVSFLTHFNTNATSGKTKEFVDAYTKKYGTETLNQFGASAYDCVYAIYEALKAAKAEGTDVSAKMSAKDVSTLMKTQLQKIELKNYVTGSSIKWNANGTVSKPADRVVVKAATVA